VTNKYMQNPLNADVPAFYFSSDRRPSTTKKLIIAVLFISCLALIPPERSQYTAASCNQRDVNAVIKGPTHTAVNGDTTTNCELSEAE